MSVTLDEAARAKQRAIVAVWLATFACAISMDAAAAQAVHRWATLQSAGAPATRREAQNVPDPAVRAAAQRHPSDTRSGWVLTFAKRVLRAPGHLVFTGCLAALLAVWHRRRWRAAAFLFTCAAVAGVGTWLLKWAVGRTRPFKGVPPLEFHPFERGLPGLIDNHNLSFPSGDASLAFATAACVGVLVPRTRPLLFIAAVVVGIERVLENAHYVSDVVGGAALGVLSVPVAWRMWRRFGAGDEAGHLIEPLAAAGDEVPPATAGGRGG
jgi:membrane-associated phospholipid phosphatase